MTAQSLALSIVALQCQSAARRLLGPISLEIETGLTAILGPNGSGKSTLLQALAGVLSRGIRVQGLISYQGRPITILTPRQRAQLITWLAQDTQSSPHGGFQTSLLTVQGLVELSALARQGWVRSSASDQQQIVEQCLEKFDLIALRHESLQNISGGELQRAQLARVFAVQSEILLLDEPSNHLDLQHQHSLERAMSDDDQQAAETVRACIYSTHDLNFALKADRLILLKHGMVCENLRLSEVSDEVLAHKLGECFSTSLKVHHVFGQRQVIRAGD
jgi:iron complex transport system ATP-binding protein